MNLLITGGAGFIGSHLCRQLINEGHHVSVIDDLSTGKLENIKELLDHPRFQFVNDSILNREVMSTLIEANEQVYHLAAVVGVKLVVEDPIKTITTNIGGTEIVLELARKFGNKVLIASSSEVYGKSQKVPFEEDDDRILGATTKTRWGYACTKALDEILSIAYYQKYSTPVVIVRFFNTVGERQTGTYGMVIPRFVQAALSNQDIHIYGDGNQTRCFTYVLDVVRAITALMKKEEAVGQIYNIGCNEEVSINQLAEMIIQMTNSSSSIIHIPVEKVYGSGFEDMSRRKPSLKKIHNMIGYEPEFELKEILEKVIQYTKDKD